MIKNILKKMVRMVADWPVAGRLVRIIVALIRLPEFRANYLKLELDKRQEALEKEELPKLLRALSDLACRQKAVEAEQLPELLETFSELTRRQSVFEQEQLPTLLQTISDINHRQLASENDQENLVKSVPVALRKITRDLLELQTQLKTSSEAFNHKLGSLQMQMESISKSANQRFHETQEKADVLAAALDQRLGGAEASLENAQANLENFSNSVGYLLGRVEFVRRELLFEMRYAAAPASDAEQIEARQEIVNPKKLAASRKGVLKLNLGCGHIALDGYINIDRRKLPGVDVVAEVDDLPFKQGEVDEIFSAHLLEHFPQEQLRRQLLPYYFSLLKEGGVFRAVVPDAEAMIQKYTEGEYPYDDLREVLYGAQDYEGDFHFNMFTPRSLKKLLLESGYSDVKIVSRGRVNGKCLELEMHSTKKSGA